jgi:hypothetical protein
MTPSPPRGTGRRSPLLAVILSGLAPGAGHLYVGRPLRGAALLVLVAVAAVAWGSSAARSFKAARVLGFPPLLLLLGVIVDSGVLARRGAAPSPRVAPIARWWAYAGLFVLMGWVAPAAYGAWLGTVAGWVVQPDDGMAPRVLALDRVVFDPTAYRGESPRHGDVVVVRGPEGSCRVRRVVGLPGDEVGVDAGVIRQSGVEWLADRQRGARRTGLSIPRTRVRGAEILVLSDARLPGEAEEWRVARDDLMGRATYVLVPRGLFPPDRMGVAIR